MGRTYYSLGLSFSSYAHKQSNQIIFLRYGEGYSPIHTHTPYYLQTTGIMAENLSSLICETLNWAMETQRRKRISMCLHKVSGVWSTADQQENRWTNKVFTGCEKFGRTKHGDGECVTSQCVVVPLDWMVRERYLSWYLKNEKKSFRELGEEIN